MSQWVQCNFIQTSPTWADATCGIQPQPSGGYEHQGRAIPSERRRTPEELRRRRIELGIVPPEALAAISDVAVRQVGRLEQDAQKQYDELANELALRRIEFQTGYLQALAAERERLINAEIAYRLAKRLAQQREMDVVMLTLLASAAAL